ncbi:MAG: phosphoglycerate transporter [Planctomycetes bacterium]|nr:phosphoglycerate transporter [Planctomycetota bacterium]
MTLRVGWFSTGRGEGSRRLLSAAAEAISKRELDAEIAFLFCNRERGEHDATDGFLDLAASFGIPCLTLSSRNVRRERGGALSQPGEPLPSWRLEYDRMVAKLLSQYEFDIGVLAGYMLIFTPEMTRRYPFLNLHPAEPGGPIGTWQEVIWQLIDGRAERSGVMIHLATEELDRGPMIAYCTFSLRAREFAPLWEGLGTRRSSQVRETEGEELPLFQEIRRHGAKRELALIVETLRAFADARVNLEDGRVLDGAGGALPGGLDLTPEIDAAVATSLGERGETSR